MELSKEVCESLRALGAMDEERFNLAIDEAINDSCDGKLKDDHHEACCSMRNGHSGAMVLLLEVAKKHASAQQLTAVLQELDWTQDRVSSVVAKFTSHSTAIRSNLASFTTLLPHLLDIDWKLQHTVTGVPVVAKKEGLYLLQLKIRKSVLTTTSANTTTTLACNNTASATTDEVADSRDANLQVVTLQCSLPQLIAVTDSLRQATAAVNRLAAAS